MDYIAVFVIFDFSVLLPLHQRISVDLNDSSSPNLSQSSGMTSSANQQDRNKSASNFNKSNGAEPRDTISEGDDSRKGSETNDVDGGAASRSKSTSTSQPATQSASKETTSQEETVLTSLLKDLKIYCKRFQVQRCVLFTARFPIRLFIINRHN